MFTGTTPRRISIPEPCSRSKPRRYTSLPRPSPSSWSTKKPGAAESISLVCWRGEAVSVSRSTRMSPRPRGEDHATPRTSTEAMGEGAAGDGPEGGMAFDEAGEGDGALDGAV